MMVSPWRVTSAGSLAWAMDTRFCTFTAAMSRSAPTLNVTVSVMVPSLPLREDM